jgi:hypothetical protein
MGRKTIQFAVLGVLVVVLAAKLVYEFGRPVEPAAADAVVPAAPAREAAPVRDAAPRRGGSAALTVPDVRLGALAVARDEPEGTVRNPFRLKPPPPPVPVRQAAPAVNPDQPPAPPPPPPITLKFIGLVNAGGSVGKIAVLTSGTDVFYGREGDIIDGRYKIVSIGAESVVVAYVDGRGTRRIGLTGS